VTLGGSECACGGQKIVHWARRLWLGQFSLRVGIFGVVGCGAGKRLPQFWGQPAHVMLIWARLEGQKLCVGGIGLVPQRTEEISGA
jgi:hypothetical protein